MHRLLADGSLLASESPALPREAARHLKVLRVKAGEAVELFDGAGRTRPYAVTQSGALAASGPVAFHPRRSEQLVLFACVTKGSRWDWTVEKATELGVSRIVPVISERTIVRLDGRERSVKAERWRRVAEDAARQSDAVWLPEVVEPVSFGESLAMVSECDACFVGALSTPPPVPIMAAVQDALVSRAAGSYAVYVGPEGDFTPAELESLLKAAVPVSLGPTVLRAETAAIYACTVLAAALEARGALGERDFRRRQ